MFVLDASMTMAWCFADEVTVYTEGVLELLRRTAAVAPEIWPLEVANAFLVGQRRQRLTEARALHVTSILLSLPIEIDATPLGRALGPILDLARVHNLSAYDASYIDLAQTRGLPLASNDRRLREAATRCGIALVS